MASTYVNNLRLNEMATGDASGTWGTTTNTNLEIIGQAVAWGTRAVANAATDNITIADGALDADRCLGLKLTGGGQACTVTLLPNTSSKTWFMYNATSFTLTFTCGSGANVAILAGETKVIATDGLGSGGVVYDLLTGVNLAGTTKTAALTNAGALSNQGTVTVGVDDTGYDVQFFGATSGAYVLWDESADDLKLVGAAGLTVAGDIDVDGTTNLDVVDIDGAVNMATTALVTGVLTTTATQVATGGITSGSDIVSDTDGTDSLGTTSVRWLKGWFDTLTAGTLTIGAGSIVDSSGTINFGDENLTSTGVGTFASLDISGSADIDGTLEADAITLNGTALGSLYSPIAGGSGIVTTGAINSGSITSGFGTINNGASTITTTGAVATGALTVTGAIVASGDITAFSDRRIKDNLEVIPDALSKVNQLSGYTYTRKDLEDKEEKYTGVIAQEVLNVLPEAVVLGKTPEDNMAVAYGNMVGLLIEAIKELSDRVKELEGK